MQKSKKQHLINKEIRGTEVRVSDVGILSLTEALRLAESDGLDLVLINPNAQPPVVKIMNYEKFLYEQSKKDKPKVLEMKEIKVGPNTSENDLTYRIKQISEFLGKGHKVKISMQFKGREMIHVTKGETLILKLLVDLEDYGVAEAMPKLEGKRMFVTIKPLKK
jgi:translation initiation factor IF-3